MAATHPGLQRRELLFGTLAALAAARPALAQSYPERPIKALHGFAAGGNADTIARVLGSEMSKSLGQPMIVDPQPGAGGTLASGSVARARPDGYTLLLATGGHAVAAAMMDKLAYDPVRGFQPVSTVTYFPFLLVVRADSSWRGLPDLLAAARTKAEAAIAYGSAGVGTTHHLAGELLARMAGLKLMHVPYRGDAASATALLGGEVPFVIAPATAVESHVRAGKVRALATTGPRRWSAMPELPTVAEQGLAGYDVRSWAGWMLPAGAPAPVVKRLNEATLRALQAPEVRARLQQMGGEPQGSTPEEMQAMLIAEIDKWKKLVAEAGIPKL